MHPDHEVRGRRFRRAGSHRDRHQLEGVVDLVAHLLGHDRLEVGIGDLDLAVGQLLEPRERRLQARRPARGGPSSRACRRTRARPECLPSTIWALPAPTVGRIDDLVRLAFPQHAVLVDARLVGEGVPADDRLVVLHRVPGETATIRDVRASSSVCTPISMSAEVVAAGADAPSRPLRARRCRPARRAR